VSPETHDKLLVDWDDLPQASVRLDELSPLPRRIDADPERVERGLAQLVLTLIELLRQLMERQAVRRIDHGGLTEDEVERLGLAFMRLDERMDELKQEFGLEDADLNLDLGPLGRLLE
jgi:Gas vesicle protein K